MTDALVRADFLNDVREQLANRLRLSGVPLPADVNVDDVALSYFDYKRRHLPAKPRRVMRSRELGQQVLAVDHQAGLDAIVEDAEAGRSLVPYFSRTWKNLKLRDPLFDDWYVRHLHLGGRTIESKGFVKRTGPVLFAFVNDDTLYMIDVMEHDPKKEPTAFAKKRIVQILHDNWPNVIEHGKLPDLTNLSPNDDESRRLLSRNRNGFNALLGVEVADGTVYCLISGGVMVLRMMSDALLNNAYRLQQWAASSGPQFQDEIKRSRGLSLDELHLQMEIKHIPRGVEYGVRETQAQHLVLRGRTLCFPRKP